MKKQHVLFSIGHSTHSIDEFVDLLRTYGVRQLIDVRSIPRSRHNPQFNKEDMALFLRNRKINYSHAKGLGGLRHAGKDSPNTGWRNASFRGFADYMLTDDFNIALNKLILKAKKKPTVIMCAEAVPWRCHRSLIADALIGRDWEVRHILSKNSIYSHKVTPFAKRKGGKIIYVSQGTADSPDL